MAAGVQVALDHRGVRHDLALELDHEVHATHRVREVFLREGLVLGERRLEQRTHRCQLAARELIGMDPPHECRAPVVVVTK